MKMSGRGWRMAIAGWLALAVVLVWSPHAAAAFSPVVHHPQALQHDPDAADLWSGPPGTLPARPGADCDDPGTGCCVMTHCQPAIAADPHDLPVFAAVGRTMAAGAVRGLGSGPRVVLPPPRGVAY